MISIAHPLLGSEEEAAVVSVIASGQLAQGEQVDSFERRFAEMCGVREAVAVSSGTAALHLALLAHNIGPGDEVITTLITWSLSKTHARHTRQKLVTGPSVGLALAASHSIPPRI